MSDGSSENARQAALDYHEFPKPGKLEIRATKPMANQRDLSRAYSPGVAEACLEIKADPQAAARYTAKGNLVAVVSNGSAVLGLGNIGALAGKPVMEGKAVLFKKFANIDCFDIEVNESDPVKLAEIVASLEPTFGAINLEDIKAPDCFVVERLCREKMNIPVFHDDQHGTAIVVGAAAINALRVAKKKIEDDQDRLDRRRRGRHRLPQHADQARGEAREHLALRPRGPDLRGARRRHGAGEGGLRAEERRCARVADVIPGADLFLGLSGPGVLTGEMVRQMARDPIVLRARQPRPGDRPGRGAGGEPRRDHRDRPLGLSEPGQQRPLLPLHLPRRARRRRHRDQRRDADRLRRGDRGAGAGVLLGARRRPPTRASG